MSAAINDPPPPYPSRERRTHPSRTNRRLNSQHLQLSSAESDHDPQSPQSFPGTEETPDSDLIETTPLLPPSTGRNPAGRVGRPRTLSHTSTLLSSTSAAPSLAQTLASLFQPEPDSEPDRTSADEESPRLYIQNLTTTRRQRLGRRSECRRRRRRMLNTYFRPMKQIVYYKSLFHLLIINFPFALAAWAYLFVFTLAGTTLLMALPLGAILCFFDLLGARMFARCELALQTRFHSPLAYPAPHPPRPIFTRFRERAVSEVQTLSSIESGGSPQQEHETSFYKNTYAMFTDPTSYQALFYFLVIKPGITILLLLALLITVPVAMALIVPFPAVLCAARRIGVWQANVAVEGLYMAMA